MGRPMLGFVTHMTDSENNDGIFPIVENKYDTFLKFYHFSF